MRLIHSTSRLFLLLVTLVFTSNMFAQNRIIVNPSFETGSIVPHGTVAYPESQVGDAPQIDGWYSTHPTYNGAEGAMEHWASGFNSVPAQEGGYFVELNVSQPSRLYQIVYLNNGEVIDYEYYHRKRQAETQTVEFSVYSQDGSTKIQTLSTSTASSQSAWDQVTGSATFTGASGVYQIGFEATAPASGGSGNFLDNITIGLDGLTEFSNNAITVNEGDAFDLHFLVNGEVTSLSSVTFGTAGTAVQGVDYTFGSPTVNVPIGDYGVADSISTGLSIIDNNYSDGTRTIVLTINSVTGDIQIGDSNGDGLNQTFTITILDDDPAPAGVQGVNLWLDAADVDGDGSSANDPANGTDLATWIDKSGRGNDATTAGITQGGVNNPSFETNQFNGNPAVRFDKANLEGVGATLSSSYLGPLTVFIVLESQTDTPANFDAFFSSWDNPTATGSFQIDYDGSSSFQVRHSSGTVPFEPANTELSLYGVKYDGTTLTTLIDGSVANTAAVSDLGFNAYRVGVNRNADRFFDSKIAEVIVYHRELTPCELEQVNQYLGTKYGRDFNNVASNFGFEANFPGDVNGIGAFASACSGLNTIDAATSSIISIDNPSSNDTAGEFLTLGHDNASLNEQEVDLPSTLAAGSRRIEREWKADRDGDVGTVDLEFDLTGLTITGPTSDFKLMIDLDGDGDFTTGTIDFILPTAVTGDIVSFDALTLPHSGVFTLLTLDVQVGGVAGSGLWLKADEGVTETAGNLTDWVDQTGTNDFTVTGTPTYSTNAVNFNPTVGFANTSGKTVLPTHRLTGNTPISYVEGFAVYKYNTASQTGTVIGGTTIGPNYGKAIFAADGDLRVYSGSGGNGAYQSYPNAELVNTFTINNIDVTQNTAPFATGRLNGLGQTMTDGGGTDYASISLTPIIGGTENNGSTFGWFPFNGELAEVVLYSSSLTVAEKLQIESYLAIKYGITLDASVANYVNSSGQSVWNNTTYWNDVFGIGRDDETGLNQTSSNSINTGSGDGTGQAGLGNVVISNPTGLDDSDFLMLGNDAAVLTEVTTDLPTYLGGFKRLEREWWVTHTGNVGNVDLAFDLNGITVTGSTVDQFRLLIDADSDGDFTTGQPTIVSASSFAGNIVSFSGISLPSDRAIALITEAPAPGGVASEKLWLEANAGVSATGTVLTGWADQTATNVFTVNGTPTYVENAINFNPSVEFDNSETPDNLPGDYLAGNTAIDYVEGLAVYYKSDATSGALVGGANSAAQYGKQVFGGFSSDDLYFAEGNAYHQANDPRLATGQSAAIVDYSIKAANNYFSVNGESLVPANVALSNINLIPWIGGTNNTGGSAPASGWRHFRGQVAEIIMYPDELSATDRLRSQTYLAVKYGITLDNTVTNYLASDGTTVVWNNTSYWNDVFGIAKDDDSGLDQSMSNSINTGSGDGTGQAGAGNIVLSAAGALSSISYLVVGNDAGALTESLNDLPASLSCFTRIQREWKSKVTGTVPSVDLSFDIVGLTLSGSQVADFKLIIDQDGDGDFTTGTVDVIDADGLSGSVISFNGVTLSDGVVFSFITGQENEAPTAVCQDITVQLDASGNATITGADVNNGSTDNCGVASLSVSPSSFTCANVGANTVTLTVTDNNGNTSTCTATVTVEDNIPPTATCQDITIQLNEFGTATIIGANVDNGSTDNCGIASLSVSPSSFTCANVGANTVTLTVLDDNGNSSTCTSTVTVEDNIAPTATCQDITVQLDASGNATITGADVDNGSTDNCGIATLSVSPSSFTCANVGANTVTLTVLDDNGNSSTCTSTVTVEDNIAPTASCQNITVQLDASGNASITTADVDNGSTDNCGIASLSVSPNSFTCANVGANTVTLTVTDVNGNSSSCTSTVTVEDNIAPTASCQDITVQLDASGNATITGANVDNGSTDNCGIASLSVSPSSFTCANVGANTVTLTVLDDNGNSSTCTSTVTVEDNIAPTATCQDITVQLDASGNATISGADVDNGSTDNCGIASLSVSPSSFTCANVGANTVTLTVTDDNGNSSSCTSTVTVEDNLAPTANCQNITVQLDASGNATITGADVNNGSSDNCGIASLSVSPSSFTCANVGANTVTLTVTDVNGNVSTCTSTVTVEDNIAPTANCQDITVQLDASGNATITGADVDNGSTDNCGIASLSVSPSSFTCANVGANIVTLTVTDDNGNSSSCTSTVTVEDNIAPTANCQDITVQLDGTGLATISGADVDNGSTDNCGIASLSVSPSSFTCANVGANTVTLTVTDVNGNSSSCTSTVTVEDNIAPTANCQDITVQLDGTGLATITGADVDNGSSDICGIASLSVSPAVFNCTNVGANTVTLTVTDVNGNSSTCTSTVTVEDNIAPTANCQDITVQLDAGGNATITGVDIDNGSTDNCGIASLVATPNSFTCANVGANTVTLIVTDVDGNSSTCTSTVTVEDNIAPTAICQNIIVQLDASGNATITGADVNNGSTDNCGIASLSVSPSSFTCANVGPNTVTLTVTDVNGNTSTCTATVSVVDNIAPTANCQNITVQLDASGNVTIAGSDIDNGSSDNCGIASLVASPSTFTCADLGPNTVTLTVTDVNGNSSTCTSTVTVEDNIAPTANCQDITVQLDATGNITITGADVDNGSVDNCGVASLSVSPNTFNCADIGSNTVTLTVTDASGNSSTCTSTVTVEDNVPPTAICQNITVQLDASGIVNIVPADVNNGSNDACGISTLAVSQSVFTCADLGPNTVTLTVTDNNGNISTCTSTVTVEDDLPPVITCPVNTIRNVTPTECDYVVVGGEFDPANGDNCATVTLTNDFTGGSTLAGATFPVGATDVVWTATDGSGNTSTCTITVEVIESEAPVANCQDFTIQLDVFGTATVVGADIDNGSTDNCGIASLAVSPNTFTCAEIGPNTVTLTVTDASGNSSTCTSTVTVVDNIAPIAICQDITVQLDASGNVTVTGSDVDNGSSDNCGIASLVVTPNAFTCADIGTNTVTLTVTDVNGNVSTCTSTVTVVDDLAPTAVCQDITVQLDASGNATITSGDVDNGSFDNCGIASIVVSPSTFDCTNLGSNTVTLTVTDDNGNTSSCTSTVTVQDTELPLITCPTGTVRNTTAGLCGYVVSGAEFDATFADNCGATITNDFNGTSSLDGETFPTGTTIVNWTATDASGNSSTCSISIEVNDVELPNVFCQNVTLQLDAAGIVNLTPADIDNGSSDACGISTMAVSQGVFTCADIGTNTVTLTVTDVNGNVSTCTSTVTIEDNIAPSLICPTNNNRTTTIGVCGYIAIGGEFDPANADNCSGFTLVNDFNGGSTLAGETFPVGLTSVTWTSTDASGNFSTCTMVIDVTDNEAPTASCQDITVQLDATGNAAITAAGVDNGTTDNCGAVALTVSPNTFTCADIGPNTVTLTATDAAGNVSTCTSTVTVVDNIAPNAICQDVTVQLDASGIATITAADVDNGSSDNCGVASVSVSPNTFTCLDLGTNLVTLTVTDVNGNSSTCTAVVTVIDVEAPIVSCQDITVQLDASGTALITSTDVDNGSSDNCSIASMVLSQTNFNCSDIGPNIVTLTVTDGSGNVSSCSSTVTVEDNVPPIVNCASNTIRNTTPGQCGYVTMGVEFDPTATDNCGAVILVNDYNGASTLAGEVFPVGTTNVNWTVTDAHGNSSTCSILIDVTDNETPSVVCQDITVQLDGSGLASITAADIDNGSTDNCGVSALSVSITDFDCSDIGPNPVLLTVTDVNGNSSSCTATVTVVDAIPPVISCAVNTDRDNTSGICGYVVSGSEFDPTYADNCDLGTMTVTNDFNGSSTLAGETFPVGTTTVIWTVNDGNGNAATCSIDVNVSDVEAPVASCQNLTVSVDAIGLATITAADIDNGSTDNCGIASLSVVPNAFSCADLGSNTVILTVTDAVGNSSTCTSTVIVVDNVAPTAVCQDITVQLNSNGLATIAGADVDGGSTDNCSIASYSVSPNNFSCSDVGPNTVTLTVTDQDGNTATCTAVVTVEDNAPPLIECPADDSVHIDMAATYALPDYVALGEVTASDPCGGFVTITQSPVPGTPVGVGVHTITFTAQDDDGNTSSCTYNLTVLDDLGVEPLKVSMNALDIYPNPADDQLFIRNPDLIELNSAALYDITGRKVLEIDLRNSTQEIMINIADLPAASYILYVRSDYGNKEFRLIVQ